MTYHGGANGNGIIFSILTSGGSFTDMHDFSGSSTDGANPERSLILSGSTLYGMTNGGGTYGVGIIFSIGTSGGTLTDLHTFTGGLTTGGLPLGDLTRSGSTLYGTTSEGGANGDGIIFSISTSGGTLTDLHDFSGSSTDGEYPYGSLTLSGSTLYGMTYQGGSNNEGIIFSISTSGGALTDLHDFSGSSTDGAYPHSSLTLSGSTLYGMTQNGGANGFGMIFSISTSGGTLTDLHDFSVGSSDGTSPAGDLTLSGSTLYGMTQFGGAIGDGIIFSISTSGGALTDLHDFSDSSTDGSGPAGDLTLSGSTLYGMASSGGANNDGIIFSISTSGGALTDLHDFSGSSTDGAAPNGSLTLLGSTLYGMSQQGGAYGFGIIFSISTSGGTLTDLHDYSGDPTDGANPLGSLNM
jgi:uncharacterized repeat protein (TIGR03803 family)